MDLMNGTPEKIKGVYDGEAFVFPPFEYVSVNDEAGTHLLQKCSRLGLIEIHFGDNPQQIKLECMRNLLHFHQRALESHARANAKQKEQNFPALVSSDAVRLATRLVPILQEAVGKLEAKLGTAETDDLRARTLAGIEEQQADPEPVTEMSINKLRAEARRVGIDYKPHWGKAKLIEAILAKAAPIEEQQLDALDVAL